MSDDARNSWAYTRWLIGTDLHRHAGRRDWKTFLRHWFLTPGFKCVCVHRICHFLRVRRDPLSRLLFPVFQLLHHRVKNHYGISIPYGTRIGPGFYVGHFGGIFLNAGSVIGRDCNLSQGVTLGRSGRGEHVGAPTLGDRVYVGPGAKLVGGISIGDDAAIGANAVVPRDVPAGAVAAGVPAKVISDKGSAVYIARTDYPPFRG